MIDVGPRLRQFRGDLGAEPPQFDDLPAQADLGVRHLPTSPGLRVKLAFEVPVTLGECVAGYARFLGQGDDRQRAVGMLRGSLQDAGLGRADTVAFVGRGAHAVPSWRVGCNSPCTIENAATSAVITSALPERSSPSRLGPGGMVGTCPSSGRRRR